MLCKQQQTFAKKKKKNSDLHLNAILISDENKKHTHFASGVEKGLLSEEVRYSTSRRETSVELLKRVYGPIRLIPPGTASLQYRANTQILTKTYLFFKLQPSFPTLFVNWFRHRRPKRWELGGESLIL